MSKVIIRKDAGKAVCELSDKLALKINTEKYRAVPVKKYLEDFNRSINGGMTYAEKHEAGLIK